MISKTSWGQKHVSCVVLPITTSFHYGDVPIKTQPLLLELELALPRTPKEQVFGLIIDDFKSALVLRKHKMMAMPQFGRQGLLGAGWCVCCGVIE